MRGFHPIGELLGEIDWLLDAPDAEDTGRPVKPGSKLLPVSAEMRTDYLSDSHLMEVRVINLEHGALADFHFSEWIHNSVRACWWDRVITQKGKC